MTQLVAAFWCEGATEMTWSMDPGQDDTYTVEKRASFVIEIRLAWVYHADSFSYIHLS